jgi:MFS family permease
MVGFGETYVGAFLVFLGATPDQAGAMGSWPPLFGAVAGAIAVDLIDRVRKRRRVTVAFAGVTGLVYLLLLLVPFVVPTWPVYPAIACWLVYLAAGNIAGPVWNSWIGDLVPPESRGSWFGWRSGWITAVTLVCIVAGGLVLHRFRDRGDAALGFTIILALAFVSRMISTFYLSRMEEPDYAPRTSDYFTFRQFLARSSRSNYARFTFGIALMYFCVHLSGPFFALYQLKTLNWTYLQFMLSTGTQAAVTFATQWWWGRLGDRRGSRFVLLASGTLCSVLPTLWCLTTDFRVILAIQTLAGFCWGGFNLATGNFLYEAVTPPKRARCAAYFNLITACGIFAGALTGTWLFAHAPDLPGLPSPFLFLFALSGALRLPVVWLWLRGITDGERAHAELREKARMELELRLPVKGDSGDAV